MEHFFLLGARSISFLGLRSVIWLVLNIIQLTISLGLGSTSDGLIIGPLPFNIITIFGVITLVSVLYGDSLICLAIFAFQMLSTGAASAVLFPSTLDAQVTQKPKLCKEAKTVHYWKTFERRKGRVTRRKGSLYGAKPVDIMPSVLEEKEGNDEICKPRLERSMDVQIEAARWRKPLGCFAFDERKRRRQSPRAFAFRFLLPPQFTPPLGVHKGSKGELGDCFHHGYREKAELLSATSHVTLIISQQAL